MNRYAILLLLLPVFSFASPKPIPVLVLSGQNNHDWKTTTPEIVRILTAGGRFTVDVNEHPEQLDTQSLAKYQVIVSNWNAWGDAKIKEWPEAARTAVLDFVRNGKGFVTVHAGSSSFYDWPEYQKMTGAQWNLGATGHGAVHSFVLRVVDPGHPVTHGLHLFLIRDELWHRAGVQPGVQPLMTAYSDPASGGSGGDEPLVLSSTYGRGRSFILLLGHDSEAMKSVGFKVLLQRGVEWAATGTATEPAPATPLSQADFATAVGMLRAEKAGERRDAMLLLEYHTGCAAGRPKAAWTAQQYAAIAADQNASREARIFACGQLSIIAGKAQVPVLISLLNDHVLGSRARFTLERIPGEEAVAALRSSAKRTTGVERIGCINALGYRRDAGSIPLLAPLLASSDRATASAAMDAMGRIGTPQAFSLLLSKEKTVAGLLKIPFGLSLLNCADSLTASWRSDLSLPVCKRLSSAKWPPQIRSAAFQSFVRCSAGTRDLVVMDAFKRGDSVLANAAANVLRGDPSIKLNASSWSRLAELPVRSQILLLQVAETRRDAGALHAATKALASKYPGVRLAAMRTLATLGSATSASTLGRLAGSAVKEEREAAGEALVRLNGADVNKYLIKSLAQPEPARSVFIKVITERGVNSASSALLTLAETDNGSRGDALKSLAVLGSIDYCAPLLAMLEKTTPENKSVVEATITAICSRAGSSAPIRTALAAANASNKIELIAMLGTVGGKEALPPLIDAMHSEDADIRSASLQALGDWQDASPLDQIQAFALTTKDAESRSLALRCVARMVPMATDRSPETRADVLAKALAVAERPDNQKALVSALGSSPCLNSLHLAVEKMKDPALREEASLAAMQIAEVIWRTCTDDASALAHSFENSDNGALRSRSTALLLKLSKAENLAIGATATSPDGLNADGQSSGDQAAIDGDPATYWDEEDNKSLYILRVQLALPSDVSKLRIMGYEQQNYAPRNFEIVCDGTVVKRVENAQYDNNWLLVAFPSVKCQVVELRITGYYGLSPAIRELEIYK